jgi:pyruvate dehydrogenase E1 component alpha subunit
MEKKKQQTPDNGTTQQIDLYKRMLFYRRFEERVNLAYTKQKFSGFCHLQIGQEAVCVGIGSCLRPDDYMIASYRSHTHAIEKGISAETVFAELFAKEAGCSRGKGGSMHMFSKEARFMGGHGIVGSQVPLATGIGFAVRYRKENAVVVCFLGDGAMNQGQVYEAFNMAVLWKLPVIFVVENNQYGMGTDFRRVTSVAELTSRALGFNMPSRSLDGMNVLAVQQGFSEVVDEVRNKSIPYLVEALTYRYQGHSVSDPATYRSKEELDSYRQKDPILQMAQYLHTIAAASKEDLLQWDQEAKERVLAAETFADQAAAPAESSLWEDVFAPPSS